MQIDPSYATSSLQRLHSLEKLKPLTALRSSMDSLSGAPSSHPGAFSRVWNFVKNTFSWVFAKAAELYSKIYTWCFSQAEVEEESALVKNLEDIALHPIEVAKATKNKKNIFLLFEMLFDQFIENPETFLKDCIKHKNKLKVFIEKVGKSNYDILLYGKNIDLKRALLAIRGNKNGLTTQKAKNFYNSLSEEFKELIPTVGQSLEAFSNVLRAALEDSIPLTALSQEEQKDLSALKDLFSVAIPSIVEKIKETPQLFTDYFSNIYPKYKKNLQLTPGKSFGALIRAVFTIKDFLRLPLFMRSPLKTILGYFDSPSKQAALEKLLSDPKSLPLEISLELPHLIHETLTPFFEEETTVSLIQKLLALCEENHPFAVYCLTKMQALLENENQAAKFQRKLSKGLASLIKSGIEV